MPGQIGHTVTALSCCWKGEKPGLAWEGGGVEKKMRKREGSKKVKRKSEDEKR